jgi:hypothetical protein
MSIIQSVLFNRNLNTFNSSYKWLVDHDFKTYKCDITENYFRWRQVDPKKNSEFRLKTIDEKKQIKFVIEYPKKKKSPPPTYKHNYGRRV